MQTVLIDRSVDRQIDESSLPTQNYANIYNKSTTTTKKNKRRFNDEVMPLHIVENEHFYHIFSG